MKFDNGREVIESPLFGDKRKIDRTQEVKGRVNRVSFTYSKNVYQLRLNDEVVFEALRQKSRDEPDIEKTIFLEEGSHIIGVYGKFMRDKYNIHHVSWFSFIVCQPNFRDYF